MTAREIGKLGAVAQVRAAPFVVDGARRRIHRLGDGETAAPDAEIERLIEVAAALLEHVAPGDAGVGGAMLDVGRHVGVAHHQHAQLGRRQLEHQLARAVLDRRQVDAGAREQRDRLILHATLGHGQRDHDGIIRPLAISR